MGHKYHTTPLAIFFHIVLTINHYPKNFPPLLGFLPTANVTYNSPFVLCIQKAKDLVRENVLLVKNTNKGITTAMLGKTNKRIKLVNIWPRMQEYFYYHSCILRLGIFQFFMLHS